MTTNVPQIQFTSTGFVAPTQEEILAGVQADINAAFGGGLNPSLSTPQGQLASSFAAIIAECYNAFVELSNQFNPDFADGRYQAALGEIYFITPSSSEATVVDVVCTGGAGVPIPAGSLVQMVDGNIYTSQNDAQIGEGGTVTIQFACNTLGPIPCPAESVAKIYRSIPGWDTAQNPDDGVIGSDVESRQQFENRRKASVAVNSTNTNAAIQGEVLKVEGVLDAYVIDNPLSTPATIGGVVVDPNSLFVSAVGGTDADVAKAIWTKKPPGCNMTGNTTEIVEGSPDLYSPPLPQWTIKFERPENLPILFAVNILNNSQVPANAADQIKAAIIAAFAGSDGGARATIGSTIFAARYSPAVIALGQWAQLISIKVGSSNNPTATFNGVIAGTTLTTSSESGTVAIGQYVEGDGVLPGTVITAGASHTWTVSKSQTVSLTAMSGIAVTRDDVVVNIDQEPTINADNIGVTLS